MRRVEALLGAPRHRVQSARSGICWFYGRSTQPLSPGQVCFKRQRASFVMSPALAAVQLGVIERGGGSLTPAAVDKTRRELRQEGYHDIQCSEKRVAGKLTSITCGGDKPGVAGLDTTTLTPLPSADELSVAGKMQPNPTSPNPRWRATRHMVARPNSGTRRPFAGL